MRKLLILCGCAVLAVSSAMADGGRTIDKDAARQQGGQLGTALNPNIQNNLKTGDPATVVPNYNPNPTQKSYFQGGQGATVAPGTSRVTACSSAGDVECQAVNLMRQGKATRPEFNIHRTDPLLTNSKNLTTNPTGTIGNIFTNYDTCKTTTQTTPPIFETQVCNEFSKNENKTCKMGQEVVVDPDYIYKCLETVQSQANATCTVGRVVVVDPDYIYKCLQTIQSESNATCNIGRVVVVDADANYQCTQSPKKIENLRCNRRLIVTCEQVAGNCASAGVVRGSVSVSNGSYSFTFDGTNMVLSNPITAVNSRTEAAFSFTVSGANRLQQFAITGIESDNWVGIEVNGRYIGTHTRHFGGFNTGSDRLTLGYVPYCYDTESGQQCYDDLRVIYGPGENDNYYPETGGGMYTSVFYDLRPFIVEGPNVIRMFVINGGGPGLGKIYIRVDQKCNANCTDSWDNQCASLESRSQ